MEILTEHTCQVCNGPLEVMGDLGEKLWCRCRDCGMWQIVDLNYEPWVPDREYEIGYAQTCRYGD